MKYSVIAKSLALVPVLCFGLVFGQSRAIGGPPSSSPPPRASGNAIAGYVYGAEDVKNGEDLADKVVEKLADSQKYSKPRQRSAEFFRRVERLERRGLPDDVDFCRIGGEFGVNYLCILEMEKAGRGASVWGRIIDLSNCKVVATAEFTGLVRSPAEIDRAASELSRELLFHRMNKRISGSAPPPAPLPPPPRQRGNAIAGYVFGADDMKNGEELAEQVVTKLTNLRKYSQPKRRSAEFFREVEKLEHIKARRGGLPEDKDFCRIGNDFGVDFLCIIDIEKRGRAASVWARILDLDKCAIVATGEARDLIRNPEEINKVSDELVRELSHQRIGLRSVLQR